MNRTEKLKLENQRTRLIVVVLVFVLLIAAGLLLRGVLWPESPLAIDPNPDPAPVETPPVDPGPEIPAPVEVVPELQGAFIVAIDNRSEARPHSGLEDADLVYEMLAEWRVTRFLAVFYTKAVPVIGPVRSARYYSAQLSAPYNTPYAHCGGSMDGLQMIRDLRIPDLDEITNSQPAFWRDKSRLAPHNLYTSTELMLSEARRRGLNITPLPGLSVGSIDAGTEAENLKIVYSVRDPSRYLINYSVEWKWEEGVYTRFMNGKPHDTTDGNIITAANIVVISVPHRDIVRIADTYWRTEMDLTGTGEALFLRDGVSYSGTWKKTNVQDHYEFTVDGKPYMFAEGNTWIQIVPGMEVVSYEEASSRQPPGSSQKKAGSGMDNPPLAGAGEPV